MLVDCGLILDNGEFYLIETTITSFSSAKRAPLYASDEEEPRKKAPP
jgi:hypothetical protein